MKKILLAGMALASLSLVGISSAEARDGCGVHKFRADNGRCYFYRQQYRTYNYGYNDYQGGPTIGLNLFGGNGYNNGYGYNNGFGFGFGDNGGYRHDGGDWRHRHHD